MAGDQKSTSRDELLFEGELPINYYGNEDVVGIFADQVIISHLNNMFTVYFYQMQIPAVVGDPSSAEIKAQLLESLKHVPAKCVARVVLTPALMGEFYKAMGTNLDRHKNRQVQVQAPKAEE